MLFDGLQKDCSANRLLVRDVRAFATFDDFGGGHDTYGDPPIMDIVVPEGVTTSMLCCAITAQGEDAIMVIMTVY